MTTSDLHIPRTSDIIAAALDSRDSAVRLDDQAAIRQIDRLIAKLPGARLCWQLGTLHVHSPSGGRYEVTRAGCSCLNAQKGHARQCWHVALFETLLGMLDTEAETADQEADEAARLADVFQHRLEATERALGAMRVSQGRAMGQRLCTARQVVWAVNWNS